MDRVDGKTIAKKTIGIFSTFFLPNMGGVEKFTDNIAKVLTANKGFRVIIVTLALCESDVGISKDEGIEVIRLPSVLLLNKRFAYQKNCREADVLFDYLNKQGIDYILVNQRFFPLSLKGIDFARENNIPVVVMDHGSAHLTMSNQFLDIPIHLYEHLITSRVKKRNPAYCAVSEKSSEWLNHFNINTVGIVHNAINVQRFEKIASKRNFLQEVGIPEDAFTVVFTGRLVPEKGIFKLCKAIEELSEEGFCGIHLLIAGDGNCRTAIENISSQAIHYIGRLDPEDISSLLKQCDVFCLPTVSEGFSTSMLEAAASSMGVIISDTGGARELISSEKYGIVLKDSEVGSIKTAILRFYEDEDYLHQASINVYERVDSMFNWNNSAEELIAIFKAIEDGKGDF